MKLANTLALAVTAIVISACGGNDNTPNVEPTTTSASGIINPPTEFCFFTSNPPAEGVEYQLLKNAKAAKGTYGSVTEVIPKFETRVQDLGGNAAINFKASQRFGWWIWRLVRPVASGRAINITNTNGLSCHDMGGLTEAEILEGKR